MPKNQPAVQKGQTPRTVTYAACESYAQETLRISLEKILEPQLREAGGVSGKKIVLKPNLLAWRRKDDIACVHPALILETARLFREAGASEVAIMENPAVQTAPAIIRAMGIEEELNKIRVRVFNFKQYAPITNPPDGAELRFRHIEVAQEHLQYDTIVDIAKAKTHAMMTLTLCVKNLFGLVNGSERMGWHLAVGKDFAMFADMLLDIYLMIRPQFNILDAIVCMEGNGPGSGTPAHRGFLAGASDSLALDASAAPILGVPDLLLLRRAAERGLLPLFENSGSIPDCPALELPAPPGILSEWGMPLPPFLKEWMRSVMVSKPLLNEEKCIGCGLCARMCPPKSLKIGSKGRPVFDLGNCIRCYCCQEHCPEGAITPYKTLPMKAVTFLEKSIRGCFGFGCSGKG